MAQEQLAKIYQLRSEGAGTVLEDLTNINKAFIEIINTKQVLGRQRIAIEDPKQLADIDKQLAGLKQREADLLVQMREKQSVAKERTISASKELKDNEALAGSYAQLSAKYKELLSIAKSTVSITDPAAVKEAATELATLKAQLDAFDQTLRRTTSDQLENAAAVEKTAAARKELNLEIVQAGNDVAAGRDAGGAVAVSDEQLAREEELRRRIDAEALAQNQATEATVENTAAAQANATVVEEDLTLLEQLASQLVVLTNEQRLVNAQLEQAAVNFKKGEISADEYEVATTRLTARQIELKNEISQVRIQANAAAKENIAVQTSMQSLSTTLGILRTQYRNMTAAERESAEGKELLTTIQTLDKEIKVLDGTLGNHQRNVGNYTGVLGNASGIAGKFLSVVERMGIRMVATIVIFEAISKIIEYVSKKIEEQSEGLTEEEKQLKKTGEAMDKFHQRQETMLKDLKEEIDARRELANTGNYNVTSGFNEGGIRDMERQLEVLKAQQETGRNALRDKEASKKLDQDIYNLEQNITREKIKAQQGIVNLAEASFNQHATDLFKDGYLKQLNQEKETLKDLQNQLTVNEALYKKQQEDKYNPYHKPKEPHDQTRVQLKEEQDFTKELSAETQKRLEIEAAGFKFIADDEKQTLDTRLAAYREYSQLHFQAQSEKLAAEYLESQQALDKIKAIEEKGGKLTNQEQDLILQKPVLLQRQKNIELELKQLRVTTAQDTANAVLNIQADEVTKRLQQISNIKAAEEKSRDEQLTTLRQKEKDHIITYKEFKEEEKKINDQAAIHEEQTVAAYLQKQIDDLKAKGVDTRKLQEALNAAMNALYKADAKAFDDSEEAKEQRRKKFYDTLKAGVLNSLDTITQGIIDNENREIQKSNEKTSTILSNQKELALAQATSAAEKDAINKEYDQKQERLQKDQFARQKKLALEQLELEFAVASAKAAASATGTGPAWWADFLTKEAAVALEYAAKYAVVQSSNYEFGGALPKVLGYGGIFDGPSHGRGGVNFLWNGMPVQTEGNEGFVINKGSMGMGRAFTVTGTPSQIASAANTVGGGVNFAPGASIQSFAYGGALGLGLSAPVFNATSFSADDKFWAMMGMMQGMADSMSARIDNLQVVLNPNAVEKANDKRRKAVKIGTL